LKLLFRESKNKWKPTCKEWLNVPAATFQDFDALSYDVFHGAEARSSSPGINLLKRLVSLGSKCWSYQGTRSGVHMSKRQNYGNTNLVLLRLGLAEGRARGVQNLYF
jgi:hypothetical protein